MMQPDDNEYSGMHSELCKDHICHPVEDNTCWWTGISRTYKNRGLEDDTKCDHALCGTVDGIGESQIRNTACTVFFIDVLSWW